MPWALCIALMLLLTVGLPCAAAERAVLYEEDPNNPRGERHVGSVTWRTEIMPSPVGPPELAVRCDIVVWKRRMTVRWSLRRNTDKSLPASHAVEIEFMLPPDFPGGGVQEVLGLSMKQAEQTRGAPLAGLAAVTVKPGSFLIGLSALNTDVLRNMHLLKERSWFDIPIVYHHGRRAILAMEKGISGQRAFAEAFAVWSGPPDENAERRWDCPSPTTNFKKACHSSCGPRSTIRPTLGCFDRSNTRAWGGIERSSWDRLRTKLPRSKCSARLKRPGICIHLIRLRQQAVAHRSYEQIVSERSFGFARKAPL